MKPLTLLEGFQQKRIALALLFRNLGKDGIEVAIKIILDGRSWCLDQVTLQVMRSQIMVLNHRSTKICWLIGYAVQEPEDAARVLGLRLEGWTDY